jgi:hypothetical protein
MTSRTTIQLLLALIGTVQQDPLIPGPIREAHPELATSLPESLTEASDCIVSA